jgi:hypothetical protein
VARDGDRVRLFTRNGHDWADRYPWIFEAVKNRHKQFVINGEAVLLGVDGISDFNALHSRRHDEEVQLYVFDVLALDGEDLRSLPLSMRKTKLARLMARRPAGIFLAHIRAGRDRSRPVQGRVQHGAGRHGVEAGRSLLSRRPIEGLGQDQKPQASGLSAGAGSVLGIYFAAR